MRTINKILIISSVVLAFLPTGRAFMSSLQSSGNWGEIPIPPFNGRSSEKSCLDYLTKENVTFDMWMNRAKRYVAKREFEQAILAFRKALEERPLSEEAHFLLGVSFEKRGKEGLPGDMTSWDVLAEKEYLSAISLGDHLPARFNLGMLLTRLGRRVEARKEWEHILMVSPKSKLGRVAMEELQNNQHSDFLPSILQQEIPSSAD